MLLIAAGIWLPSVIAPFDWHRLFQHLLIFVLWILASVCAAQFSRQQPRFRPAMIVVVGLLALIVLKGMNVAEAGDFTHTQRLSRMLRSYTAADVSYDALRTLNTRIWERDKDQSFYAFLAKNSDLDPHGIRPANFALAPANQFPAELPNIFIFVVDSLRQDYIAPYNPRVTFAPNIAAFAKESVVFKNAFSRYGGTALSEPAIWAGVLQLHTKYIEPYYPMNSLEKLAAAAHYDCYVTEDEVVRQLLDPAHKLNRLDELNSGPRWMKVDLPETLKELEADIEGRKSKDPIFVYTQAQNLHAVELYTIENVRKRARNYPGFDDLRASEVERLDHGFGEFIEYLKQKGMYEHSVIVLTSDHGDNLGELGRWGHFGLFPQVMRVPLIVHLPPELQKQVFWDPEAPAFSLDITPSLYYLLGQRPIANDELFGRPLFTQSRTELGQYRRSWYLVASSYGPAYGTLSGDGRWLYISDGVERNDYYFDMAADPEGLDNLIDSQARKENESRIREGIEAINQFYRYSPK
jgi:phosphoglycerol transferase MdoB-like AlkP superfamily enzyme